jgi:hypothetical protein
LISHLSFHVIYRGNTVISCGADKAYSTKK